MASENDGQDASNVKKLLDDADYLLGYAAESGIDLDDELVRTIVRAGTAEKLTDEETVDVMNAVARLAKALQPVTAETLRNFETKAESTVKRYWMWTVAIGGILVFLSAVSFVVTGFSKSLDDAIAQANQLAVTLTADVNPQIAQLKEYEPNTVVVASRSTDNATAQAGQLAVTLTANVNPQIEQPKDYEPNTVVVAVGRKSNPSAARVADAGTGLYAKSSLKRCALANNELTTNPSSTKDLTNLQQFAATARQVYGLAQYLRALMLYTIPQVQMDESVLEVKYPINVPCEVLDKIPRYQGIRNYAKTIQQQASMIYGALNISILPAFYAVLGAFAFLLKSMSVQLNARTFTQSYAADFARLTMAAIAGEVIGLFSSLFTMGAETSLPLLGLAFFVGYRTDVFFSFLDGLQQSFGKGSTPDVKKT